MNKLPDNVRRSDRKSHTGGREKEGGRGKDGSPITWSQGTVYVTSNGHKNQYTIRRGFVSNEQKNRHTIFKFTVTLTRHHMISVMIFHVSHKLVT